VAIPHPLGNPALSSEKEAEMRLNMVREALRQLCE
jgi:hypothetical protein